MEAYSRLHVSFSSKASHSSVHTIYCKKHSVRQNSDVTPNLRTLFSLGWPPYCCPGDVESIFSRVGSIEKVFLMANPGSVDTKVVGTRVNTFCVGYVVFRAESDLDLALKLSSNSEVIPCPLSQVGLSKWMSQYMEERPKLSLLEDMAEVGVSCYDRQQEKVKLSRKRANVPDEDGWITVTKKNPKIDVSFWLKIFFVLVPQ